MSDRVTVDIVDHIADVRLSRPDKMNALDPAMFNALSETGRDLAKRADVRVVVLSGQGKAFCAGLDFASFLSLDTNDPDADLLTRSAGQAANRAQSAAWIWKELPMPVIAAVHGVAYGGGLQIMAAADIRFVAPDARLSVRELHWGLIPDMSGTRTLRDVVRLDVLKELTYTARIVPGTDAVALGLATHIADDPRSAAFELAREIAGRNPDAIRGAKHLLDRAYRLDDIDGLLLEEQVQRTLLGTPNQAEAVTANMEKRAPIFSDPKQV
ncbi:MAG: enoyl-CoA hydratase/carnithine racemase [Hyphomicrobiaceae bacterium]|jgi:enoyl-CoA hydratase/carnithine racemase